MDVLTGQVVPLLLFGGVCAVGYAYATGSFSKKRTKPVKRTQDPTHSEDAFVVPEKKKKGKAPVRAQPKKTKVKERVELIDLSDDDDDHDHVVQEVAQKPTVPPAKVVTKPTQPSPAVQKQSRTADAVPPTKTKATATPSVPVNPRDAEIELLKQKIRELEAQQQKAAQPPAQPVRTSGQGAGKAKAKSQVTPAKAKDDANDYNPPPSLTPEQHAEQQRLFAQYEEWKVVEAPSKKRSKSTIDMQKLLDTAPVLTTVSDLTVDGTQRGTILGHKGQTLSLLTKQTGCQVEMPQELRVNPAMGIREEDVQRAKYKILLQGTPQQIRDARAIMNELLSLGYSPTLFPNMDESRLRVNKAQHKFIVVERAKISKITRVRIDIPAETSDDDIISLKGEKDQVDIAKAAIRSLVLHGYSDLTHPGWTSVETDFPAQYRHVLLRNKGRLAQSIRHAHGCRLSFPQDQHKNEVKLIGPQDMIADAIASLQLVVAKLEEPVENVYAVGFDSFDFSSNEKW